MFGGIKYAKKPRKSSKKSVKKKSSKTTKKRTIKRKSSKKTEIVSIAISFNPSMTLKWLGDNAVAKEMGSEGNSVHFHRNKMFFDSALLPLLASICRLAS